MKHRLLDFLRCNNCGRDGLRLVNAVTREISFKHELDHVKCQNFCAFKQIAVSGSTIKPRDCVSCYGQEIVEGKLTCECGKEYPIVAGIPRFLPARLASNFESIQKTFSSEWKMFRFGERNWGQDIDYRKNMFLEGIGATPESLKGGVILDAGCGSGLLSMEMAKSFGMEVIALDLAFGIEKAYEYNDSPFVHFVQGSVLELPLKRHAVDYVYCAGVLVALPDTREGFLSVIGPLKKGGRCFMWVYHPIDKKYHPGDYTKMVAYNWIRRNVTSRLPIGIQYSGYLATMPIFLLKQKIDLLTGKKRDAMTWREKMQALFDMFSPIYQNRHTHEEVIGWFQKQGFSNVHVADAGNYGFGVKGDWGVYDTKVGGEPASLPHRAEAR
jgi:ubiquinone/menaquinone biosynthesis C-methylase UbiE